MKKLVIVDGSGFIYRAFFALPKFTKSDGTPIGAVFGFTKMLLSILTNNSMDYFVIIFDKAKKTFRHEIYPEYKQNRKETPDELKPQFRIIRDVCDALNVPYVEEEGFEADDLIAAYTKLAKSEGFLVKIVSGDKDLIQLLRDGVELYDPIKSKDITESEVALKYSIKPTQMVDFLALCGDASDNIPGVPSVGPKTAAELLKEFGSLEKIIAGAEKISNKKRVHEKIVEHQELARLSKILATTDADSPVNTPIESLKTRNINIDSARLFLEENEFLSLIPKLAFIKQLDKTKNCNSIDDIDALLSNVLQKGYVCIAKNSIKTDDDDEIYLSKAQYPARFIDLLGNNTILKLSDDAKSLFHMNQHLCNFEDLSIMSFLTNGKDAAYSISKKSFEILKQKLINTNQLSIYENMEKPIIKILYSIEQIGFAADANVLRKLHLFFEELLVTIKENIFILSGKEINLDSPKQVAELLFNHLQIAYLKNGKRPTKQSTDQDVLEELARNGYEIANHILQWRQISKLNSTYTTTLANTISKETGRVHTTLNITNTITGRLSSSEPNLQNIPVKTNIGKKIREAFVAPVGKSLISMDYSQIELRILAHLSKCEKLLCAFKNDCDIHTITASEIFHIDPSNVTEELRRKAKAINFGIIYGMSSFGVSKRIQMSNKESDEFIKNYFNKYREVEQYITHITNFAEQHGYVETVLGRKCFIKDINSSNFHLRKFSQRQSINAPIQGSSADIITMAMLAISQNPNITAKMVLQIHDELIFEVDTKIAQSQATTIKETMEAQEIIECPLKVNFSIGHTWSEL